MPSTVWRGYISFGLARSAQTRLREIHRECGTRIHHPLYCPYDERIVSPAEIAMGCAVERTNTF
jgi:non-homologous end joining protein Ku